MATIDLGKLRFTWKGIFDANAAYERDDVVHVDGSTYVVVVDDIAANGNESPPDENNKFELMARGLNYRGNYSASATYLHNEVVSHNSAAWISIRSTPFDNVEPGTNQNYWVVLVPAPLNTPLNTPGDMVYVENDGERVRLPIGDVGATLEVVKKPRETFPRAFTYTRRTNSILTTADSTDAAVVTDANRANGTYNIGKNDYTTSGSGTDATFKVIVNASGTASVTVVGGGGGYAANDTITIQDAKLGSGGGVALVFSVATVNSGATAQVTDDDDNSIVFSGNPTALQVTRGETYVVTFTGVVASTNYSLKATRSAGGANRLPGSPDVAQEGATITFSPGNFAQSVESFFIGDEIGGADQVEFEVNNEIRVPSWSGGAITDYEPASISSNNFYNLDETDLFLPAWSKKFGHGTPQENNAHGREKSGYLAKGGRMITFGNTGIVATHQPYDGSYGTYPYPMTSGGIELNKDVSFRMPSIYFKAINGDPDYAHLLTDIEGNDLGLDNIYDVPKVVKYAMGDHNAAYLLANGMLFVSGANNASIHGGGNATPADLISPQMVSFFIDGNTTPLEGANFPKIKHFTSCFSTAVQGRCDGAHCAIDTNGFMYLWGTNGTGVLGQNNLTTENFAVRVPPETWGTLDSGAARKPKLAFMQGAASCSLYVICEDGVVFVSGNNADGQLGIGTVTTAEQQFVRLDTISGHPFANRKVVHICPTGGQAANTHKTHWLCDDGTVWFSGFSETHGAYSGVYSQTATVDVSTPVQLTRSTDTINSEVNGVAQKVVSMWSAGGRYSTQWYVTDAGKMYAQGQNSHGQMGCGKGIADSPTATTNQNEWMLQECTFSNMGDTWETATALVADSDEKEGIRSTFTDSSHTNYRALKVGNTMKVVSANQGADLTSGAMMLDDNGQCWICGEWATFNPNQWTERDTELTTDGTNDYYNSWVPCWSQPEKFVDIQMPDLNIYGSWWGLGQSGVLYGGGYGVDGNLGMRISNSVGWSTVPLTVK